MLQRLSISADFTAPNAATFYTRCNDVNRNEGGAYTVLMKLSYLYLAVAIVAEVIATSFLKSSDGFTKLLPSVITVVGYSISFTFLSLTLRVMPIGVAYAIWAGAGVVLIATVGWLWHGQALDLPALIGLGLIVSGVVVVNLFSKTVGH